jgi:hypothetical protein
MKPVITLTLDYINIFRDEYNGVCEPDARDYECESCGEMKVHGIEEAVLMGAIEIADGE